MDLFGGQYLPCGGAIPCRTDGVPLAPEEPAEEITQGIIVLRQEDGYLRRLRALSDAPLSSESDFLPPSDKGKLNHVSHGKRFLPGPRPPP